MSAYTPGDAAEYGCLSCGALPPVNVEYDPDGTVIGGVRLAHFCSLECLHDDEHEVDFEDCAECAEIRGEDDIADERGAA